MGATCSAVPTPGCECSLEGGHPAVKTRLRVGCSAWLLDAPIQFALANGKYQALGVNLNWVQCPSDASAAVSMLSAGLIDMALMFTEDALAHTVAGSSLRICGTYAATPRLYGVHVMGGTNRTLSSEDELQSYVLGIPNDKGGNLMMSVLSDHPGWSSMYTLPRRQYTTLRRVADAMARDQIQVAIWDRRSARSLVAAGQWDLICERPMPWASLVLVAEREALYSKAGALKHFIKFARGACEEFKANKLDAAVNHMMLHYGLDHEDAAAFLQSASWNCGCEVDAATVTTPLEHLVRMGLVPADRHYDPGRFLAKDICALNQVGAPSAVAPKQLREFEADEDFGFPAEQTCPLPFDSSPPCRQPANLEGDDSTLAVSPQLPVTVGLALDHHPVPAG